MQLDLSISHRLPDLDLNVTLTCAPGVTAIFGPSGAGKTTILRAIAGLLHPQQAHISLGPDILCDTQQKKFTPPHRRHLGVVFQDARLFPHLSASENIRFGLRYAKGRPALVSEDDLIELLGISTLLNRRPGSLSGGEAQRIAIARALLSAPNALLMDEPLAALDGPRKDELLPYLERLKTAANIPILYVTHALPELARLADRVALLDQGRIVREGDTAEILSDPAAMPYFGVREAGSILSATVVGATSHGLTRLQTAAGFLELPGVTAEPGDTVRLRIPAHDVILATEKPKGLSARNILPATVRALEPGRGPGVAVVLALGDQAILARITDASRRELTLEPGKPVWVILKATAVSRAAIGR